jgi:hypothetical protein
MNPLLAGTICIAAFQAAEPLQPNMSATTWGPSAASVYEFRVGKGLQASVRNGETVSIEGVPTDRRVLVGVRLDGRPYESFHIDLREEPDQRACLWLYRGYWHWVNTGWDESKGCRCVESCRQSAKLGDLTLTLAEAQRIQSVARQYLAKQSLPLPSAAMIDCEGVVRMDGWILEPASDAELRLAYRIAQTNVSIVRQELRVKRVGKEWQVLGSSQVIHHLR